MPNEEYVLVGMVDEAEEAAPLQGGPTSPVPTSPIQQRLHSRFPYTSTILILTLGISWSILTYFSYTQNQVELGTWGCGMSWMNPRYVKMEGPKGEGMGGLERKYGLWLYRESGLQKEETKPTGQPVLFIPGNAGSYQQVRSVAASAARQYADTRRAGHESDWQDLDFYAVDFNEEFSAFHGHTLRDQSHYVAHVIRHILSLYHSHSHSTSSSDLPQILLLGHSMGGIVARHALTLVHSKFDQPRDEISHQVAGIIVLSSPVGLPPVGFDKGMEEVYGDVERFWVDRMRVGGDVEAAGVGGDGNVTLPPVLVSICGGTADTQIASDYCSLPTYATSDPTTSSEPSSPPVMDQGSMTIFTTGMEGVWTGVEHQAMVWCDQVRTRVATGLLDMGGVLRKRGARSSEGGEGTGMRGGEQRDQRKELTRIARERFMGERPIEVLDPGLSDSALRIDLANTKWTELNPVRQGFHHKTDEKRFVVADISSIGISETIQILGHLDIRHSTNIVNAPNTEIYTCSKKGSTLSCAPAKLAEISVFPASPPGVLRKTFPEPHVGAQGDEAMAYVEIVLKDQPGSTSHVVIKVEGSGWGFLGATGSARSVESWNELRSTFKVQLLEHSLLAYRVERVITGYCSAPTSSIISPLLRYRARPRSPGFTSESRLFPAFFNESVRLHSHSSGAPFVSKGISSSMDLDIWQDPNETCAIQGLAISIDWRALPGLMYLRYRTTLVIWTLGIAAMIFSCQLRHYRLTGNRREQTAILNDISRQDILKIAGGVLVLQTAQIGLVALDFDIGIKLLAGIGDLGLAWVGFPLISVAVCLVVIGQSLLDFVLLLLPWRGRASTGVAAIKPSALRLGIAVLAPFALLCICVMTFLPVQAGFVLLFVYHLLVVAGNAPRDSMISGVHRGLLSLLFWLLPLQGVVVLVWIRHQIESPNGPFNGEHNPLVLLPVMLVQLLLSTGIFREDSSRSSTILAEVAMLAVGALALLIGASWAHLLMPSASIAVGVLGWTMIRKR